MNNQVCTGSEITAGGELDPLLGATDDNRLSNLTEVSTDPLELTRRQLYYTTVVCLLDNTQRRINGRNTDNRIQTNPLNRKHWDI